jgi:hypothetical protein
MGSPKALDPPLWLDQHLQPSGAAADLASPTWRYRLLLLAIGSVTPNGSDVTASDRQILLGIDQHLARCAATQGEAAAARALGSVIEVLETGDPHAGRIPH